MSYKFNNRFPHSKFRDELKILHDNVHALTYQFVHSGVTVTMIHLNT